MNLSPFHPPFKLNIITLSQKKGFSVVELIVVVAIIGIMSAIALANYSSHNERVSIQGAVEQVALSVRQAQASAVGAREYPQASGNFDTGWGVYFHTTTPTDYIFFADPAHTSLYNGSLSCTAINNCVERVFYKQGYTTKEICVGASPGSLDCTTYNVLSIVFTRPNLGPTIRPTLASGTFPYAEVRLQSPKGLVKTMAIWSTGYSLIQ